MRLHQNNLDSVQTASSEVARDINRDIILDLIRFRQPLARAELARISGLGPSTVSAIVEQLIEENWVQEGAVIKPLRGRPSTMLSVNSDLVAFAIDLRPDRAALAVVDLTGRFLSRETVPLSTDLHKTVLRLGKRMRDLREEYSLKRVEGIGISIPGRVHPETQRVLMAPNLNWHEFDLKAALEDISGLQVEMDNDANVCMISELWFGRLHGAKNAVLIAVAEGIGASILAGGQMHSGYNGLAGEFGHISVDPQGLLCQCGQRGCWEMVGSSRAAIRLFNSYGRQKAKTIFDLIQFAENGDKDAIRALTEQSRAFGRGLRLVTAALSPELILVAGDITAYWDLCGPIVAQELATSTLAGPPPLLKAAGDAELARLSGGAAMLMQRHARYHHSTHAA